jgi:hypothetical protein
MVNVFNRGREGLQKLTYMSPEIITRGAREGPGDGNLWVWWGQKPTRVAAT